MNIKWILWVFIPTLFVPQSAFCEHNSKNQPNTIVILSTGKGDIKIELYNQKSPVTVENFLKYVKKGFYKDTIFHRVIDGFMIQGGGYDTKLTKKETLPPIENESKNGLKNIKGSVAMARTNAPHSATSQFFINLAENPYLNGSTTQYGYTVFGQVVEGMEMVEQIAKVKTGKDETKNLNNLPLNRADVLIKLVFVSQ